LECCPSSGACMKAFVRFSAVSEIAQNAKWIL
jgi:hypothetical protein